MNSLRKQKWFIKKKIEVEKKQKQEIEKRIKNIKETKEKKATLPFTEMKSICSNYNFLKNVSSSSKQAEFENMYDYMTAHIHQHTKSIDQFQAQSKPIFNAIYVEVRNLIFDFFRSSIDVFSIDLHGWFSYDRLSHALVRSQYSGYFQSEKSDRR